MTDPAVEHRSAMDWRAAIWAGLIAGLLFLILSIAILWAVVGAAPGVLFRYTASIVLGEGVLPPPTSFEPLIVAVALLTHFLLSVLYACVVAFIVHRGGLWTGIIGGALFGLALYAINYYTFSYFFPWFFALRSWIVIVSHVLFGAVAGGIYETLERDQFIIIEEESIIEGDNHV
jgi:hypothetical protein